MPRPTAAQIAYGTATVVCSTLVMLLLSGTSAGIGIAVIGLAALALGLLVAVTATMPRRTRATKAPGTAPVHTSASMDAPAQPARVPGPRAHTGAERRIGQPSLRR